MWIIGKSSYALVLIIFTVNGEAAKKRACIVGAGISGLVAVKYFSEYPNEFEPIIFEKNSDVGGLWIYTDSTTVDEHGLPVHSSIYKSLRTNSVKRQLTFPDYPHFGGEPGDGIFVKHEDILQYLRNYTEHFNLRKYIQFDTNVLKVSPLSNLRWLFVTKNLNTGRSSKILCDVAVMCNGFNVKGNVPKIPGIESFRGHVMHSHLYRRPETFTNQTVVLLGASYSGRDIGIDISPAAKKVYLSHRHKKIPADFPPNLEQVSSVVAANGNSLILSNGTKIPADALIFCTGYVYDFPFLEESSGISVEKGKYIHSIYKHFLNIERPTMALINVPEPKFHFQNPHAQMQYFRTMLLGNLSLPTREQMRREAQLPPNVPRSKAHDIADYACNYYDELEIASGGKPYPWWFLPASDALKKVVDEEPMYYKNKRLVIHEDDRSVEFV